MDEKLLKWLHDVKLAIDEIESYFEDHPKTFDEYKNNSILKRAIERNLEIIGEAVSRILKFSKDIPISNARNIIGLRNQIIHSYDNISDEYLWGVIVKHLPVLKSEILNLIS
jgi:uncharacterized protein with HEPN domain